MSEVIYLACDDSGFTGPDLLDKGQRFFSYASVAIQDNEAFDLIQSVRARYPVQMPELKGRDLMKSKNGRKLVEAVLEEIDGRYVVNINDKLLALCGWFFEYIYEPVLQDAADFLRKKNLHRFVAGFVYTWMTANSEKARSVIEQFQRYIRTGDPMNAPFLFRGPGPLAPKMDDADPFECLLHFAYGYRSRIITDNARMLAAAGDDQKWTLDLSLSALWSHLNFWGKRGQPLAMLCDHSKPLQASVDHLYGDTAAQLLRYNREIHPDEHWGYQLQGPIVFGDSRDHPAIQIADIVAGAIFAVVSKDFPEEFGAIAKKLEPHVHKHSITWDIDPVDLSKRPAAVNFLVIYDLAVKAERGVDPYENLAAMYRVAETSWDKGEAAKIL